MRYIELFAGIGGFRYGLEGVIQDVPGAGGGSVVPIRDREHSNKWTPAKYTCVYSNEWDKYAAQIYRRHYGEIDTRDIRDVSEFPDFDLLTAGFPCQAFSVAGKRLGFEDTRGTLFFEIARILKSKRPRHLLLENVKGLLSHKQGQTFNTILGILSDLGYRTEWMVLNSKHFGVPQNRERVFIIGHLRGECSGEVFPLRQSNGINNESGKVRSKDIHSGCVNPKTYSPQYRTDNSTVMIQVGNVGKTDHNSIQDRVYSTEGIAKTLAGEAGGKGAKTGLYAMRGRDNGQELELRGDETNSLTSVSKDNLWLENARIRRLTPVECERLQGFPDGWTARGEIKANIKISDSQRYKCLGNAVTTNVITAIGEQLRRHINAQH